MNRFQKHLALAVAAAACLGAAAAPALAEVGVVIGAAPICPYGYYDSPPYACAPAGYYGPEWFLDGVFVGAGPWFHGREPFRGRVDRNFDVRQGYRGAVPPVGEPHDPALHGDRMAQFGGHEWHEAGGHASGGRH